MLTGDIAMTVADYSGGGHMDWGGGWWILMAAGMVLFWGLLVFGLVRGFSLFRERDGSSRSEDPQKILERRLAEGLITPEEYRERKDLLTAGLSEPDVPD